MTGASPIPLVTVVVPVVSVSVLGVVVVVILPLEERGNPVTGRHSWRRTERHDVHSSSPATPPLALPEDTHIPTVLSVIVSVSVVLIISPVEPIIVSPVSIVEVTVTLRKEERTFTGCRHHDPLPSHFKRDTRQSLI